MQKMPDVVDVELESLLKRMGDTKIVCAKCEAISADRFPGGLCKKCHDRDAQERNLATEMFQLPPAFRHKKFSDVQDRGNIAKVKTALTTADLRRKGVYLHGGVGSGKTLLMSAIFGGLAWRGVPIRWTRMVDFLNLIRDAYRPGSQTSDDAVISNAAHCAAHGVLMIDDFGTERVTDWVEEKVYDLVDRVYGSGGRLWVTSNLPIGKLAEHVGDRVTSRLVGMCEIVRLDAPDFRMEKIK
jgi:DNA replication protein DnaC